MKNLHKEFAHWTPMRQQEDILEKAGVSRQLLREFGRNEDSRHRLHEDELIYFFIANSILRYILFPEIMNYGGLIASRLGAG